MLSKTSGAASFRIQDPGHGILLKEAEELRKGEIIEWYMFKTVKDWKKTNKNRIVNLAIRWIKQDTRKG